MNTGGSMIESMNVAHPAICVVAGKALRRRGRRLVDPVALAPSPDGAAERRVGADQIDRLVLGAGVGAPFSPVSSR